MHLLVHSPHLSPVWTLSCSAEESTPSSDPPESAVTKHSRQREAQEERRAEDLTLIWETELCRDNPYSQNSLKLQCAVLHVVASEGHACINIKIRIEIKASSSDQAIATLSKSCRSALRATSPTSLSFQKGN